MPSVRSATFGSWQYTGELRPLEDGVSLLSGYDSLEYLNLSGHLQQKTIHLFTQRYQRPYLYGNGPPFSRSAIPFEVRHSRGSVFQWRDR
jgi:hypothetical protein